MSARIRGRNAWHWWWLSLADRVGVPLVELNNVLVADLVTYRNRKRS